MKTKTIEGKEYQVKKTKEGFMCSMCAFGDGKEISDMICFCIIRLDCILNGEYYVNIPKP